MDEISYQTDYLDLKKIGGLGPKEYMLSRILHLNVRKTDLLEQKS